MLFVSSSIRCIGNIDPTPMLHPHGLLDEVDTNRNPHKIDGTNELVATSIV